MTRKKTGQEARAPRRLCSIAEACEITTFSRSTVYRKVREGTFPKPVIVPGMRRSAFVADEIHDLIDAMIAARDAGRAA
ncbi:helix-turn-helix transcriptional regulator [Aurantimonas endophytica]|uniref:helix-turn-helix transcriptional regulator n=1 Tax=Aurantimonas endophytica TaxID=1522175 RepID=UPI003AB96DD2